MMSANTVSSIEWIFGYGSLMWDPGFPYVDRRPAILKGFRRQFCIYSYYYRGTREQPGLVLGLNRGGECHGIAFRVQPSEWKDTITYLDKRELVGYAYQASHQPIIFEDGTESCAHTYTADSTHPSFAGHLGIANSFQMIQHAEGVAGTNWDYAIRVIRELEANGLRDTHLNELLEKGRQSEEINPPSNIHMC